MVAQRKRKGKGGGWNRISIEEHRRRGTLRRDTHGGRYEEKWSYKDFSYKPKARAKSTCGSAKKWIKHAGDECAVSEGCYFDERLAAYAADWFEKFLSHSKGRWAGEPFKLLDWQRFDVVYPIFGWLRPDKTRRIRRTYIEVPKKNGKSTLAAGIGLYMLVGDGEAGSHVFSAAAAREQASIVHGEAIRMVTASKLGEWLDINRSRNWILRDDHNLYYRALASKASHNEGHDGHCCIVDELHAWHGDALWDTLRYMGRARRQPLIFVITTAGDDMESQCRKQHDQAEQIRDGVVEEASILPYIRAADAEDDLNDPATWYKANPSLGHTFTEEDFAVDVKEGQANLRSLSALKRYSFNLWSSGGFAWLDIDDWEKCTTDFPTDGPCWAGLDLARKSDTSALILAFDLGGGDYGLKAWYWLPEVRAKMLEKFASWADWGRRGDVRLTSGEIADFDVLLEDIVNIFDDYDVRQLIYDPHFASELTARIEEESGVERVEFRQTLANYSEWCSTYERLLKAGSLLNDGNKVLAWQASHVSVKEGANGGLMPIKPKGGDYKTVDGVVASIMALAGAIRGEGETSPYDERGVVTI